jgi:hypothetical protein
MSVLESALERIMKLAISQQETHIDISCRGLDTKEKANII